MRIGFDIAQTCGPKAGCGWVADCLAREFLRVSPQHEYIWYHHFDSWINPNTDGGPVFDARVATPFHGVSADDARAQWQTIRRTGQMPGRPDVVHAHSFNAPKIKGARLVFTAYDVSFWAHPEFTTDLNRLTCQRGVLDALAHADGFYFISEHARSEFDRMTGGWLQESRRPTLVHYLAPRHAAPSEGWRKGLDGPWLSVGSLEPRKNLDFLLDAYRIYAEKSRIVRPLRMVGGSGWMRESLLGRISRWPHRGSVFYAGYVPDSDLLDEYRAAFGLTFPSHYEGFGLPVLEAMQQHTPVICGRVASLPEVGGDAAIYADIVDPEKFAAAMLALEDDEATYRRRSAASVAQSSKFTWEGLVGALEAFYARLVSPEGSPQFPPPESGPPVKLAPTLPLPVPPLTTFSTSAMLPAKDSVLDIDRLMERIRSDVALRRTPPPPKVSPKPVPRYTLGTLLRFGLDGNAAPFLGSGWSHPEPEFRWTDGSMAEILLTFDRPMPDLVLSFSAIPMRVNETESQPVSLAWNGSLVGEWTVSDSKTQHTLIFATSSGDPSVARLTFRLPQAFSPLSQNMGTDTRKLGLAFREMVLRPAHELGFE